MRRLAFLGVAALLVGCVTKEWSAIANNYQVAYYDRNHDGIVDYELITHRSGHADDDWGLVDTKFRGRYNLLVHWGYVVKKERVDIPVPKDVKITPGKPPKRYVP